MLQPTTESLMKVLQGILAGFRHAYIVLNALDECAEREKLLSFIEQINNWKLGTLHILVMSQPETVVSECLASRVSSTIDLQSAVVDIDIQIHIHKKLQSDPHLKKWPSNIKEEIATSLMKGANGM